MLTPPDPRDVPTAHRLWTVDHARHEAVTQARYDESVIVTEEQAWEVTRPSTGRTTFPQHKRRNAVGMRWRAQILGIHDVVHVDARTDEATCTCGLLVPAGTELMAAVGHRALPGLGRVVHVFATTTRGGIYRVACQRCGHTVEDLNDGSAVGERTRHERICQPPTPWGPGRAGEQEGR